MLIKNVNVSLLFLLMLFFLSACEATSKSESEMKNKGDTLVHESSISTSEPYHPSADSNSNHSESLVEAQEDASIVDVFREAAGEEKDKVNKLSPDIDTDDSAVNLTYLDFKGNYAHYEGEPRHSQISETLLLEEDYIDWAGLEANVQNYDIQNNTLELTVIQQIKDSSSDQVLYTNVYYLTYTLDYFGPYKVLINLDGKAYYEIPYEEDAS